MALADHDVFINVVGGMRVPETGADLPMLLALYSSFRDRPAGERLVCFGEVGLSGEIRPVHDGEQRLREAAGHGFFCDRRDSYHAVAAKDAWERVTRLRPYGVEGLEGLALAHARAGDAYLEEEAYAEAVIEYKNVLQIDPNDAVAHFGLARAYLALGGGRARWELQETIRLDPTHDEARLLLEISAPRALLDLEPRARRERRSAAAALPPGAGGSRAQGGLRHDARRHRRAGATRTLRNGRLRNTRRRIMRAPRDRGEPERLPDLRDPGNDMPGFRKRQQAVPRVPKGCGDRALLAPRGSEKNDTGTPRNAAACIGGP